MQIGQIVMVSGGGIHWKCEVMGMAENEGTIIVRHLDNNKLYRVNQEWIQL